MAKTAEPDYIRAHRYSIRNRESAMNSDICGCFHCLKTFPPSEVGLWICDEGEDTAMCPECMTDSVIGPAAGFPIDEKLLKSMRRHWFGSEEVDEYGPGIPWEEAQKRLKEGRR